MNTAAPPSDFAVVFCYACTLLVPFAAVGITLINCGLGRSRNAAHSMIASLCAMTAAALAYFVCGFSWQSFPGRAAHAIHLGATSWNWLGSDPLFLRGLDLRLSPDAAAAWLGVICAGLAAVIPLGSGAERWRLSGICVSSAITGGFVYPLFAHWIWGGGWLESLGSQHGLGRGFADAGGAATVQAVGGFTALSISWILGARRGKFPKEGMSAVIPGHNTVFVLFGCMLALAGWLGLNIAATILFSGTGLDRVVQAAIDTILSAGSAALASMAMTRARFGMPDASLAANAWIGGLVAVSAGCAFVAPLAAVIIGAAAGLLVTLSIGALELHLKIDDPGGSISVHAIAAIWGLLAVGLFEHLPDSTGSGQWIAQLAGVATLLGFGLPLTFGLNALGNRLIPYRTAPEGDRQGLDLNELGSTAYPEVSSHGDDFYLR